MVDKLQHLRYIKINGNKNKKRNGAQTNSSQTIKTKKNKTWETRTQKGGKKIKSRNRNETPRKTSN